MLANVNTSPALTASTRRRQLVDDRPAIVAEAARSGWDAVLTRRTGDEPFEEYTPEGPIR